MRKMKYIHLGPIKVEGNLHLCSNGTTCRAEIDLGLSRLIREPVNVNLIQKLKIPKTRDQISCQ